MTFMPKSSRKTLLRALKRLRKYRLRTTAAFLCAAVGVLTSLVAPILAGKAIDSMIVGAVSVPIGVLSALFYYGIAAAVNAIAGWASHAISVGICSRVARDLRDEAASKLRTLPLKYLDSHSSGDILSRITVDVETFSDALLFHISSQAPASSWFARS